MEKSLSKTELFSFLRYVSIWVKHGKMESTHEKITGEQIFFVPWAIKEANIVLFQAIPSCNPKNLFQVFDS